MKSALRFLLLTGLAALCLALPYARAVTSVRRAQTSQHPFLLRQTVPASSSTRPSTPSPASVLPDVQPPIHILPADRMLGPVNATSTTESLWLSPSRVISVENCQNETTTVAVYDAETGKRTLFDPFGTPAAHQEENRSISEFHLSPDDRWVLWPSGSDARPIWTAISLDGQERREWPRAIDAGGRGDVAWMQDSRHWVQLSQTDLTGTSAGCVVRVFDTETSQIEEHPLVPDIPQQDFSLPSQGASCQFIFTQDGRAWLSMDWETCFSFGPSPSEFYSRLDTYELLPGAETWTLHKSAITMAPFSKVGMYEQCARSPDDQWLIWGNLDIAGKRSWRLVLTQVDGSNPQIIYTSQTEYSGSIHWAGDSLHVVFCGGDAIYRLTLSGLEAKASHTGPGTSNQVANCVKVQGKFPVAAHQGQLTAQLSKAP